jgi:pyrimidine deaminase RibD-like protein
VPVVGCDVAEEADLAALRYCGHAAGGHCDRHAVAQAAIWPAPGSEDTELGVILEPEVVYGTQTLCTRVQA